MSAIQITKRSDDYHAAAASDSRVWGCGKTPEAAIGDLILSHQEFFDVRVYQDGKRQSKVELP